MEALVSVAVQAVRANGEFLHYSHITSNSPIDIISPRKRMARIRGMVDFAT